MKENIELDYLVNSTSHANRRIDNVPPTFLASNRAKLFFSWLMQFSKFRLVPVGPTRLSKSGEI